MHTPGHGVVNLAVLGSAAPPDLALPILLGAVVPDLPILVLYVRERWLHGTPKEQIWADHYQRRFWQNWIHGMHSLPIAIAGLALGWSIGAPSITAFFASALLHALADFPLHADDAHRHFFPLSHYRFKSPISYWDARYHGPYVALAEVVLVLATTSFLWASYSNPLGRGLLMLVNLWYPFHYWRSYLQRPTQRDAES